MTLYCAHQITSHIMRARQSGAEQISERVGTTDRERPAGKGVTGELGFFMAVQLAANGAQQGEQQ